MYLWPSTWIDENIADEIRAGSRMVYFANSITRMTELVTALIKQGILEFQKEEASDVLSNGSLIQKFRVGIQQKQDYKGMMKISKVMLENF